MHKMKRFISLLLLMVMTFSSVISYADTNSNDIKKNNQTESIPDNKSKISGVKEIPTGLSKIYLDNHAGDDNNSGSEPGSGVKTFGKAAELIGKGNEGIISLVSEVVVDSDENWNVGGATKYVEVAEEFGYGNITIENVLTGDYKPDASEVYEYTFETQDYYDEEWNHIESEPLEGEYTIDDGERKPIVDGKISLKANEKATLLNIAPNSYRVTFNKPKDSNYASGILIRDFGYIYKESRENDDKLQYIFDHKLSDNLVFVHDYKYEIPEGKSGKIVINNFLTGEKLYDEDTEIEYRLERFESKSVQNVEVPFTGTYSINGVEKGDIPENKTIKLKNHDSLIFKDLPYGFYRVVNVTRGKIGGVDYKFSDVETNWERDYKTQNPIGELTDIFNGSAKERHKYEAITFSNEYAGMESGNSLVSGISSNLKMENLVFDGVNASKIANRGNPITHIIGMGKMSESDTSLTLKDVIVQNFKSPFIYQNIFVLGTAFTMNGGGILNNDLVDNSAIAATASNISEDHEKPNIIISIVNINGITVSGNGREITENSGYENMPHIITVDESVFNIANSTISDNTSLRGAISYDSYGDDFSSSEYNSTINNTRIINNKGYFFGGMSVSGDHIVTLEDITINSNEIIHNEGKSDINAAGLGVITGGTVIMNSGTISENKNIPVDREDFQYYAKCFGGVGVGGDGKSSTFTMNGGTISNNTGSNGGGVGVGGNEGMPQRRRRSTMNYAGQDEKNQNPNVNLNLLLEGDFAPKNDSTKFEVQITGNGYDETFTMSYFDSHKSIHLEPGEYTVSEVTSKDDDYLNTTITINYDRVEGTSRKFKVEEGTYYYLDVTNLYKSYKSSFIMNGGEISENTAIGAPDSNSFGNDYNKPGSGGGVFLADGVVKILGDSIITENKAEWEEFKQGEDVIKEIADSMKFPRGNGVYVANQDIIPGEKGFYLGGSPKINKNNDIFLDAYHIDGEDDEEGKPIYRQTFIQIEDGYNGGSGDNQVQLTTPINWIEYYDYTENEYKYVEITRPVIEDKDMGTKLVDYSAVGTESEAEKAASEAQTLKYFAGSKHMVGDPDGETEEEKKEGILNGYNPEKYPEYSGGFNIGQSTFKNNFLVFKNGTEIFNEAIGNMAPPKAEDNLFKFKITDVNGTPLEGKYFVKPIEEGDEPKELTDGIVELGLDETAEFINFTAGKYKIELISIPDENSEYYLKTDIALKGVKINDGKDIDSIMESVNQYGIKSIIMKRSLDLEKIPSIEFEFVVNESPSISFSSHYLNKITDLSKIVDGDEGVKEDGEFNFNITSDDEIKPVVRYSLKEDDNDKDIIEDNNTGILGLKHGQTAKIFSEPVIKDGKQVEKFNLNFEEEKPIEDSYIKTIIKVGNKETEILKDKDKDKDIKIDVEFNLNDEAKKVEFMNYYGETLKLSKKTTGTSINEDEDFEFKIVDKDNIPITGKYTVENTKKDIIDGKVAIKTGEIAIKTDLAVGEYTIVETKPESEDYKDTSISIDGGVATNGLSTTITVEKDKISNVEFTNNYGNAPVDPGKSSIKLSKKTTGTSTAKDAEFEFTVTGPNYSKTVKLGDNGEETLTNLEVGEYTITETQPKSVDYKDTSISIDGEAVIDGLSTKLNTEKDKTNSVEFTNNYDNAPVEPDKSSIKLTKRTTGTSTAKDAEFEFTVTGPNYSKTVKLGDNGEETLKDLVVGEYTIVETKPESEDYKDTTITGGTKTGDLTTKVTISKDVTGSVVYTNNYNDAPVDPGKSSIILKKVVTGNTAPKNDAYVFDIAGPNGYEVKSIELKAGESRLLNNLEIGDYTITETNYSTGNYLGTNINANGTETTGLTVTFTTKENENNVVFTNKYKDKDTPVDPTDPEEPGGTIKEITLVGGRATLTERIEKQLSSFTLHRLYGRDRYGTSADVSKEYGKRDTVVLASGEKYTDELTATVLASKMDVPILLSFKDVVPEVVMKEIERLGAKKVIIVGETGTLSKKIEKQLSEYSLERIGGETRYETAILLGERIRSITKNLDEAILVDGTNFPDAIAMTSMGVEQSMPILLTPPENFRDSTAKAIKDWKLKKVTIGGGTASVSSSIENKLKETIEVDRIKGTDRYHTSVLVAKQVYINPVHAVVASGEVFPDAIVGAPYAAKKRYPIVLSRGNDVPTVVMDYVNGR